MISEEQAFALVLEKLGKDVANDLIGNVVYISDKKGYFKKKNGWLFGFKINPPDENMMLDPDRFLVIVYDDGEVYVPPIF